MFWPVHDVIYSRDSYDEIIWDKTTRDMIFPKIKGLEHGTNEYAV